MPEANFYKFLVIPEPDNPAKNWHFFIKTLKFDSIPGTFWEYSCGCCINFPAASMPKIPGAVLNCKGGNKVKKITSFWAKEDSPKTSHYSCPKDPKFPNHLQRIVNRLAAPRPEYLFLAKSLLIPVQIPENRIEYKKERQLPESLRQSLEKENKKTSEKGMTDEQLEDLFARTHKKKQKKSTKKPNKGKAPNNIRKTKKPVKL
ncbi:Oidioi.mRNA.OKI2018_I69.chr2.g4719.t1.cds [Oikopleura dioica]|uniref:Oidioi.mRNA.OKI2018_I69.chr2.g4719.t1.cds n=1 Tax=Oikopleura dioica TaxID=34765 RepID=A0ABN7SYM6_OIKDI|nr:Oidioi.mRNA.OKI2018_I69.chr2.g4719.t1.cds [Oikopleura dioica]